MTDRDALADKIAEIPIGQFSILLGMNDSLHFKEILAARNTIVAALRGQPRYLNGCLRDGVCRGVCRNTDCPNHGMVVAARVCVEPKEDGVVYPGGERS